MFLSDVSNESQNTSGFLGLKSMNYSYFCQNISDRNLFLSRTIYCAIATNCGIGIETILTILNIRCQATTIREFDWVFEFY